MKTSALLLAATALLAVTAASGQPAGMMPQYQTDSLGNGLYAFRYGPYRNIFVVGENGVIVTDPLSAAAAVALELEIRKVTDKPVTYVAYSHSHWDHAVGGTIFKEAGARFVAQENCRENIRETPHADLVEPDIVFRDRYRIDAGNASLELFWFGPSHSDCLSVMLARPANVIFIVDIANPPSGWNKAYNPTLPDTYLHNLPRYLAAVEKLAADHGVTTIVGGHISLGRGAGSRPFLQPATGPISAVTEQREFWETVIGAVRAELARGTPTEQVADAIAGSAFEAKIANYDRAEMAILYRVVASYVRAGRP
ncbi:MAG: MBL fold metallo-hydrolase [Gammaproteobacteria bacterium]|nr:MAG: MBL fold metallo-hydrolase [Gammaproteobacteria bacterium]